MRQILLIFSNKVLQIQGKEQTGNCVIKYLLKYYN